MASKTFSLGEDGAKGACTKVLLLLLMGAVIVAGIIIGVFAFQSAVDGCDGPKMDENGLSNYTTGAKTIAFGCFPGYFVDQESQGDSNIVTSHCVKKQWKPEPPTCNYLPIRLDCTVDDHGLDGRITIMQMDLQSPTNIFGLIRYKDAIKTEGHITEIIPLSRHTPKCEVNQQYNISGEIDSIGEVDEEYLLKIVFESKSLKAYKMAEIHFSMVFLDLNTTATLISVHQGSVTLVLPSKPSHFGLDSTNKTNAIDTTENSFSDSTSKTS